MAEHARYSPSALEYKEACPCFEYKQDKQEEDEDKESAAEQGTRMHKAVETRDKTLCRTDEERMVFDNVLMFLNSLVDHAKAAGFELVEEIKEQRVTVKGLTFGHPDQVFIWKKTVINNEQEVIVCEADLIDYKFIFTDSVSSPDKNLQIQAYACGLLEERPELQAVRARILAPWISWNPEPVQITHDLVPLIRKRITDIIEECVDPFKKPRTGDICTKCAHVSRCPVFSKDVATVVVTKSGLPLPGNWNITEATSLYERAVLQVYANAVENWAEAIKKANSELLALNPDAEFPGHSTVRRAGHHVVSKNDIATEILISKFSTAELSSCIKFKYKELVKLYEKHYGAAGIDELAKDLEGCIDKTKDIVYLQRRKSVTMQALIEQGGA